MIVKVVMEEHEGYGDAESVLNEIREKMESDYPEITSYEVEE